MTPKTGGDCRRRVGPAQAFKNRRRGDGRDIGENLPSRGTAEKPSRCRFDVFVGRQSDDLKVKHFAKGNLLRELGDDDPFVAEWPICQVHTVVIRNTVHARQMLEEWAVACAHLPWIDGDEHGVWNPDLRWSTPEQSIFNIIAAKWVRDGKLPKNYPGSMQNRKRLYGRRIKETVLNSGPTWVYADTPRIIWRTSHLNEADIPDLLGDYAREFVIQPVWSDEMCLEFLRNEYGFAAHAFNVVRSGPHKADIWRYAILHKYGGIYLDIKTCLYDDLARCVVPPADGKFTWTAVLNFDRTHIWNPLMLRALKLAVKHKKRVNSDYHLYCRQLKRICEDEYGSLLQAPVTLETETSRLQVLLERCDEADCHVQGRKGGTMKDRYGLCCNAYREGEVSPTFQVRDPRYPWR